MASANRHEDKVLLVLTLIIGAVVGLAVVAFILLTERLGRAPLSRAWGGVAAPRDPRGGIALATGLLLARYFPNARGSGIPQTKVALFLRDGFISLRTVLGKFGLCSVTLASGIALGREGPSVQVGAGHRVGARPAARPLARRASKRWSRSAPRPRWPPRSIRRSPPCSSRSKK